MYTAAPGFLLRPENNFIYARNDYAWEGEMRRIKPHRS